MTLEQDRKHHQVAFECDSCGAIEESTGVYGEDDFLFMWNEMKKEGWCAIKVRDEWNHKCPKCVKNRFFERPE